MLKKLVCVIVLLAVCSTLLTSTVALASPGLKINAGGWFYNNDDPASDKVSFGLNAQQIGDTGTEAKGKFQMIIHHSNGDLTRVHGTITEKPITSLYQFGGTCSVTGQGDGFLYIAVIDNGEPGASSGDWVWFRYWTVDGIETYSGTLLGGNAQYKP